MILFKGKQNDLDAVFPPMFKLEGILCVRNGISTRSKFLIGFYDMALYLSKVSDDAEEVIMSPCAKQIRMVSRRPIKGTLLGKQLTDGIKANSSLEDFVRFKAVMDEMFADIIATGTIQEGEMFKFDFVPNKGVRLSYDSNDSLPYIDVAGFDQAILRNWLGERPVSEEIKKDLLGL